MIVEYGDEIVFSLAPASQYYDIGGQLALVGRPLRDREHGPLSVTPQTLADAETKAIAKGAVAFVFPCPVNETQYASTLREQGYAVAECSYTGAPIAAEPVPLPPGVSIRIANTDDVPQIMTIWERKRDQYQSYAPTHWRKAPTPPEWFAGRFATWVDILSSIALVTEQDGVLRGFLIVYQPQLYPQNGNVGFEHFAVQDPQTDWATVGVALLAEVGRLACERNIARMRIASGDADRAKCSAVESSGYARTEDYFVKVFIDELPPHPQLPWDEVKHK